MTIAARIVSLLKTSPNGLDDDELANILQLKARQQANHRCRLLEKAGIITRQRVGGKIRNFLNDRLTHSTPPHLENPQKDSAKPWFWEGNVQQAIASYLSSQRYAIKSTADTASRQRGIDIIAERDNQQMWVSVKGYPVGTERTKPSLQGSHWFKQVIFDVLAYRGLSSNVDIGVGLPEFKRYRDMSQKIDWFKPVGRFKYFWVRENGEVFTE